ncbi:MAG: hypothetical protein LBI69_00605 [Puniceicoccales bacterium]|jgi:hypothetical protein|nr:hypothetical protein [Puniceicoccales bacterium]
MQNFAAQSMDIAQILLGNYIERIGEDGIIPPLDDELINGDEAGHIAYALAVFQTLHREEKSALDGPKLNDLVAGCIAAQFHYNGQNAEGCVYAAMALLTMGLNLARNIAWSRFREETQKIITTWARRQLQVRPDQMIFNVIHSIVAFSLGFTAKDDSDRQMEQLIRWLGDESIGGFMDSSWVGIRGRFDGRVVEHYVLLREALQLHGNVHIRERRLPAFRTYMQRYLRLILDITREDGTNWSFGSLQGCAADMSNISFLFYAFADDWIDAQKWPTYVTPLRRTIQHFFMQYFDQEHGVVCVRNGEHGDSADRTTATVTFDVIRQTLLWSQLAKSLKVPLELADSPSKAPYAKYVSFDRGMKKEQGLFLYRDEASGLLLQLPLVGGNGEGTSDCLAFPHCPSVFDAPSDVYLPIMLPELSFEGHVTTPSFYGKNVSTGIGMRKEFQFRYDQPDLIGLDEQLIPNAASCKVLWTFNGTQICGDFTYFPRRVIRLTSFRMAMAIAIPYSRISGISQCLSLGKENLRPAIQWDDFGGKWQDPINVIEEKNMRTRFGKICYLFSYERSTAFHLRPGKTYRFSVSFDPELAKEE